jgi:type II secretory pathway pseudopilin PulG
MQTLADERGETLVEILVTLVVIGVGLVGIVAALGGSILSSDAHRSQAQAEVIVRDVGEAFKTAAAENVEGPDYEPCPDWSDTTFFDPATADLPSGWTAQVNQVKYWLPGSSFPDGTWTTVRGTAGVEDATTCLGRYSICGEDLAACDPGHQLVTFTVSNGTNPNAAYKDIQMEGRVLLRRADT